LGILEDELELKLSCAMTKNCYDKLQRDRERERERERGEKKREKERE
jgi:hypothetical protein